MADDYVHLAAVARVEHVYRDWFSAWIVRIPVYSLGAWALFGSHVLERTFAPMYLVFALHVTSVALIARWLVVQLGPPDAAPRPAVVALAVATASLYPNTFEMLYWPTCMPLVPGAALMAAALYARLPLQIGLAALAFLSYETYYLPLLALLVAPTLVSSGLSARELALELWRRGRGFLAAGVVAVSVRIVEALREGGTYEHNLSISPAHVLLQFGLAVKQLLTVRFYGTPVTSALATAALLALLLAAGVVLWRRGNRRLVVLLALCVGSTAIYWLLAYSATRAVYGSQLMLAGVLVWLAVEVERVVRPAPRVIGLALACLASCFIAQSVSIWRIKDHNAAVLAERGAAFGRELDVCVSPCRITYGNLQAGLRRDWVLPREFWPAYLEWLQRRYAPDKRVTFVAASDVGPALTPSPPP